jgi:pimeloyl-ACP methyl ester carboxylesterase
VILFDNVGIGLTTGNTPQTIKELAADAFSFTQALQLESFNILGWSIGGLVAQVFAMNYKVHVLKVVLVATGPAASAETVFPNEQFLEVSRHDKNSPEDHQVLFFTQDENGYAETIKSLQRIEGRIGPLIPSTKKENWVAQSVAAKDFFYNEENYFNRLKEITQPVLIGGAKEDIAFPMIDFYLLAREIQNSQLIIYSKAGHGFQHQYSTLFGNIINQFLSDNAGF